MENNCKLYIVQWIEPYKLYQSSMYIELIFAKDKDQAKLIYQNYYNTMRMYPSLKEIEVLEEKPIDPGILIGSNIV